MKFWNLTPLYDPLITHKDDLLQTNWIKFQWKNTNS